MGGAQLKESVKLFDASADNVGRIDRDREMCEIHSKFNWSLDAGTAMKSQEICTSGIS